MEVNITRTPIDGKKKYGKYGAWKKSSKEHKESFKIIYL